MDTSTSYSGLGSLLSALRQCIPERIVKSVSGTTSREISGRPLPKEERRGGKTKKNVPLTDSLQGPRRRRERKVLDSWCDIFVAPATTAGWRGSLLMTGIDWGWCSVRLFRRDIRSIKKARGWTHWRLGGFLVSLLTFSLNYCQKGFMRNSK